MDDSIRIMCGICNKPVDRIMMSRSENIDIEQITVFCHGDADTMPITKRFLQEAGPEELEEMFRRGGVAFTTKRIAEGGDEDPQGTMARTPAGD